MGQTVSVDVPHKLGAEEARRRVQAGMNALQQRYGHKLSALHIVWSETRADLSVTLMGHALTGALDFLPDCVRVTLELPWMLAMIAEKAKGMIVQHTDDMLRLPPPKQG
jgi:hypothetical protein